MTRAVLAPGLSFAGVRDALEGAGWQEAPTRGLRPPLRPGEPETAVFEFGTGGALLSYSYNPAVDLRQIEGDRLPPEDVLPRADAHDVARWIADTDPATRLRGLIAAEVLGLNGLAEAAQEAAEELPQDVRHIGRLAAARLSPPEPAAMGRTAFAALPPVLRRATLRQMMADRPAGAKLVLADALRDPDPELAATAMIGAARDGGTDLGKAVKQADIAVPGLDRAGMARLKAIRGLTLETLSGGRPGDTDTPRNRFWRALLGQPSDSRDSAFLDALTLPPPEIVPVPRGESDTLVFHRIAAEPHWIGHEKPPEGRVHHAAPLQRWTPEAPFAISVTADDSALPFDRALERLSALSDKLGKTLRLPTAEEWEAAMRGPGGWPHPWGIGDRAPPGFLTGPWGLAPANAAGEWAMEGDSPVHMGTDPRGHLAARRQARPDQPACLRPALDLAMSPGDRT
ncbi:hypothetical protein RGUI_3670 [Rhodovulum sp. P5]|nr:hypothetical protein RGUI_3670 [Rhodovulum sp. P5]